MLLVAGLFFSVPLGYAAEDPQLFKIDLRGGYFEVDSRYEIQERVSSETGTVSYNNERLDIRPKVRLDLDGSVYHPNLLEYDLSLELGQSFEYEQLTQPGAAEPQQERSDQNPLQFYNGQALLLKEKKLSGSVYGNYNLIRLDNGFFSRRLVYQTGYGARLNYSGEVLPWSVSASHREEEETDTRTPRDSMQDELTFRASNQRGARGQTLFDYLFQDFARQDFNVPAYTGIRNSLRLSDSSYALGKDLHLRSNLYYNDIDSSSIPSTTLTLRELLTAQHAANLESRYNYTYGFSDSGSTESVNQTGRVSLQHQLYDSLSSTVSSDLRDTSQTSLDTFRYGFTVDESYTKQVGDASRLNLGATFSHHSEDRQSSGGDTIQIINEPHTLTDGVITTLNQPNVIESTIEVTDPAGIPYLEFIDYRVIQRGSVTEIQRVVTGSIPNGGAILVTYRIINTGSGSFTTRQNFYRFRYSLANQLLSFYGHLRIIENNGADQFVLEDLVESVFGIESAWYWFNIGAEYENYDSSLLPTESVRLFEYVTFPLSWRSSLRLSADQSWVSYPETDEEVQRFLHNIAYLSQVTQKLSFEIDGSYNIERGQNDLTLNRDLLAANLELNYLVGKTSFTATYEYRYDDYLNETRHRNTAYLRIRRLF
jgi:hypothetical protein